MLPQVKGIFNNEIHLLLLAFVKQRKFKWFSIAKNADFLAKIRHVICAKVPQKLPKFTQKLASFTSKIHPKFAQILPQKRSKKRRCFCHFAGKNWCKITPISIDFLLKIYPKMAAVEAGFSTLVGHFFATKNKVICGRFVGKIHLQLECFLYQKLCDICNFLPRIFLCKASKNVCKQLFWA